MWYKNPSLRLIIIFFLLFPLLSGCWDAQEIEQRATVLAIGIDQASNKEEDQQSEGGITHLDKNSSEPKEELIKVTAQIAVPGRIPLGPTQGQSSQNSVLIVQVVGHTIQDAMLNLQQQVAYETFLGHLRIIVLNEKVAKKGTQRFNDFLRRNPEIRRTASLAVSKEPAADYMKLVPELQRVPSLYLADMVDNLSALGRFPPSFIGLFWTILSSKGQDPYLPFLTIKDKRSIQLSGLAYFSGDRMAGKTSPLEIGFFMAIRGIGRGGYSAFIKVPGKDEFVLVKAISRKTKTKVSLKDGKPHVDIKVRYESEIEEKTSQNIYINNSRVVGKIQNQASKEIAKSLKKLIAKTQKAESDIFGFGEQFRAKYPKYWQKEIGTKEKWNQVYKDITYDVHVDSRIHRVGMKAK
ncbi:Ger(x)C family spore germination protein [Bacillus sp. ISL-18]|uniref:Ger(x)C family spore germination protein n=1 Tax=Bacillus sp. ISL-18 TaxID=2819118 RepID=UPI001BE60561|nr:Ger(x)C family spore germination protein [Bacillus sp. ISL-18]MBT2659233.1 Ger(x)C family spore germination protein [Bacillus sp. ISL-18]